MKWDTFESRLIVTASLVGQTGLRIGGSGQSAEPAAADLPVLKDEQDRPFIPGSSLRGAVRSHVERIVRTLEPTAGHGKGSCNPLEISGDTGDHACVTDTQKQEWAKSTNEGTSLAQNVWDSSCRVCRVFGSPWLASRVRFTDLTCINSARAEVRNGVAINREKETVENKYDFETVPAGARFGLEILADNLDGPELGLLWLGVEELRRGQILVGGFKGRGLGRVALEDLRLRFVDKTGLRAYLLSGELALMAPEKADAWLEAFIDSATASQAQQGEHDARKTV
jgi:CRISPR-associated RAMP protein (TIGR02581 family)